MLTNRFEMKNNSCIIFFMHLMRIFGIFPYTWKIKFDSNNPTVIKGIENIKLSKILVIWSTFLHVTISFLFVYNHENYHRVFLNTSTKSMSHTMQVTSGLYQLMIKICLTSLLISITTNNKKLANLLYEYNYIIFSSTSKLSNLIFFVFFILFSIIHCISNILYYNFLVKIIDIFVVISLVLYSLISTIIPLIFVFFFYFVSQNIGNSWKSINIPLSSKWSIVKCKNITNQKEIGKSQKNASDINEQLVCLSSKAKYVSNLNDLQIKFNSIFSSSISIILIIKIFNQIGSVFGFISETVLIEVKIASLHEIMMNILMFILICESPMGPKQQVGFHIIFN